MKKRICAWCTPDYRPAPGEVVTHGACNYHMALGVWDAVWINAFRRAFEAVRQEPTLTPISYLQASGRSER